MEKIINISGKDIKFKSTAGTLNRYRVQFKSDMIKDLMKVQTKLQGVKNDMDQFNVVDLEIFEQIAWAMAKTADSSIPPIEEWLDDFDTFSIYQILPELSDLMLSNFKGTNEQKKNIIPTVENQTH